MQNKKVSEYLPSSDLRFSLPHHIVRRQQAVDTAFSGIDIGLIGAKQGAAFALLIALGQLGADKSEQDVYDWLDAIGLAYNARNLSWEALDHATIDYLCNQPGWKRLSDTQCQFGPMVVWMRAK